MQFLISLRFFVWNFFFLLMMLLIWKKARIFFFFWFCRSSRRFLFILVGLYIQLIIRRTTPHLKGIDRTKSDSVFIVSCFFPFLCVCMFYSFFLKQFFFLFFFPKLPSSVKALFFFLYFFLIDISLAVWLGELLFAQLPSRAEKEKKRLIYYT